jgi:hypothetical protein
MKKLLIISLSVLFFSFCNSSISNSISNITIGCIKAMVDVDYIEYVYIDGQWYKITHYVDGSTGIEPVQCPPQD